MAEESEYSILYIALAQASTPLPFSSHFFSSWRKVIVLSYQGYDAFHNTLLVFYGKESDKRRLKQHMISWGNENRRLIKQVYRVYARSRMWLAHLIETEFLATHAKRKDKSPHVFCSTYYGSNAPDSLSNQTYTPSLENPLTSPNCSDFEIYEQDMLAFFPHLKKLLLNKRSAHMAPLIEHTFNSYPYFYPLTFLHPSNSRIDCEKLVQRVCTHLNNCVLYTLFVETKVKQINTLRFIENISVFLEHHFGVKYAIDMMTFKDNNVHVIDIYLSNATQYYLVLLCADLSLKELMGSKCYRIVDMVGFHDMAAIEEGWNLKCDIILARNAQEKMTTLKYENDELTHIRHVKIEKKTLKTIPHLHVFHEVPLDLYDLHNEAIASVFNDTPRKGPSGKKLTIKTGQNDDDAVIKQQEKEYIMSFLPHGAKKRFSNGTPKDEKELEWHNIVKSLPFGQYHTGSMQKGKRKRTLHGIDDILKRENISNTTLKELSSDIYISHIFNPKSAKKAILLTGPPGNGKTHYAMNVLPKILDERPVCFISVAGVQDPHVLMGHDFTYIGAKPGKIIQEVIDAKCLDPIMIFDEIDKAGSKIQNLLISLLDPLQNNAYKDAFLGNIPVDLSRAFFVMTCNAHNSEYISSPLLDRLRMVKVPSLSYDAQISILRNVIIPKVVLNIFECNDKKKGKGNYENGDTNDNNDDCGEKDILKNIGTQICDDEIAREILTLSNEQKVDDDSCVQDSLSLRCIEKTTYKVVMEFIKTILNDMQATKDNSESDDDDTQEDGDNIKHCVLSCIIKQKCKIDTSHVSRSRKAFDGSSSKKSVFLSYLYT